jgi:hypothetical protein
VANLIFLISKNSKKTPSKSKNSRSLKKFLRKKANLRNFATQKKKEKS